MGELQYYGGNGWDSCHTEGKFCVKHGDDFDFQEIEFTDLSEAKKFYDSINTEKAFWDYTTIPELIDAWN